MKLLTVLNICGISGKQNTFYYGDTLVSNLFQSFYQTPANQGSKIAVSSCASSAQVREDLTRAFQHTDICFNWIPGRYPLGVTFNDTVDQMVKHFGAFDAYLYIDSGISFWGQWGVIDYLVDKHVTNKNAITAIATSNDTGFEWNGIPTTLEPYVLPVGKAFNMHCQIFDESWRQAYGRILPDIFASDTSESVFSFMAAAIGKKIEIRKEASVLHVLSMDGPSSGFERGRSLFPGVASQKTLEAICAEGRPYGFGYEECRKVCVHIPEKYDDQGNALDERLLPFIKENLFLHPPLFDYATIERDFIPR